MLLYVRYILQRAINTVPISGKFYQAYLYASYNCEKVQFEDIFIERLLTLKDFTQNYMYLKMCDMQMGFHKNMCTINEAMCYINELPN